MRTNLREISAPLTDAKPTVMGGRNWGYVFALLGTILFSMKAILVKLIYQPTEGMALNSLDAITVMALRIGFSMPVYIGVFWFVTRRRKAEGREPIKLKDAVLGALLGMLGYYVCTWLDVEGLKYVTSQLERLLLFTYPVFVFIFGAMFFGKPLTKWAILAIGLAYAGIGVIFLGGEIAVGENVPLGAAMILFCAALFALFQLFAKPMIGRLGSSLFTCCAMLGAGTMIFIHFMTENMVTGQLSTSLDLPARIWGLGIVLALFSTLLPSFLVNIAIGRIGPQATAAMGMLSPIATIVLAIWWLGEPFGLIDALGTFLTLLGIGLYTWFDKRSKSSQLSSSLATNKQSQ